VPENAGTQAIPMTNIITSSYREEISYCHVY